MQKIINCGKNNVELWEKKATKTDTKGESFEVWEKVKSYGKTGVEEELKSIDANIEELNPIKATQKISALNERKNIILQIKAELENEK